MCSLIRTLRLFYTKISIPVKEFSSLECLIQTAHGHVMHGALDHVSTAGKTGSMHTDIKIQERQVKESHLLRISLTM